MTPHPVFSIVQPAASSSESFAVCHCRSHPTHRAFLLVPIPIAICDSGPVSSPHCPHWRYFVSNAILGIDSYISDAGLCMDFSRKGIIRMAEVITDIVGLQLADP